MMLALTLPHIPFDRFSTDTVDIEGCTPDESNALFAILSPYATAMPHPSKVRTFVHIAVFEIS